MIDQLRAGFREEAAELLAQLESALLELEDSPDEAESIGRVFRTMHTIKGSGAMFGFERIATFTHDVETVFDRVRAGQLRVGPELISHTLEARDYIKSLLDADFGGAPADEQFGARLLAYFRALTNAEASVEPAALEEVAPPAGAPQRYRVVFRPAPDIFLKGTNPLPLLDMLRDLGPAQIAARVALPELAQLDPDKCYVEWEIALETADGENAIRDVFIFLEGDCELTIEPLVPLRKTAAEVVQRAADRRSETAGVEPGPTAQKQRNETTASIRVSADKLDSLVNGVGELVTAQARLNRLAHDSGDPEIEFVAEEIERLIDRLREDAMSMRMLPIGATFARFRRLLRDLSRDLGKDVELVTEGAETELDKNVIEQLNDPLVHIIRNSVDHGVETPAERLAAGKPARARVVLSATHAGAHVLIRVCDDGAGLDRDAILRKAVANGIISEGTELPDEEVFRLIFQPGFSTASKITEISGRGVGLDVVARAVGALRGSVDVRSRRGEGTTFTLRLPLTLAIIDGLLVSVGEQNFIVPVSNIVECVELKSAHDRAQALRRSVVVRDEMIPYVNLREHFHITEPPPAIVQVILAETDHGKFGFMVDRVIGDHQTVIKSLGKVYQDVEGISGATILGDGSIALILDPDKLVAEVAAHA